MNDALTLLAFTVIPFARLTILILDLLSTNHVYSESERVDVAIFIAWNYNTSLKSKDVNVEA